MSPFTRRSKVNFNAGSDTDTLLLQKIQHVLEMLVNSVTERILDKYLPQSKYLINLRKKLCVGQC